MVQSQYDLYSATSGMFVEVIDANEIAGAKLAVRWPDPDSSGAR